MTQSNHEPMRPRNGRRFRRETRYLHHRSEGMTSRRNGGSYLQPHNNRERNPK